MKDEASGAYAQEMQRTGKGELEKDIVNGREREQLTKLVVRSGEKEERRRKSYAYVYI